MTDILSLAVVTSSATRTDPLSRSYAATSISGNAGYDCYQNWTVAAQQSLVLVAEGTIATARPATVPSDVGWVSGWVSRSVITTTAWPTATVADLYHPAVNFLVTGVPTPTSTSSSSSASDSLSDTFSLFRLGLGASIGILIVIAIGGLMALCCLYALIRRLLCGPRRVPVVVQQQQPPYYPQQQQPGEAPPMPMPMQYAHPPQYYPPLPEGQQPPAQYPGGMYQPQVQYGYGK